MRSQLALCTAFVFVSCSSLFAVANDLEIAELTPDPQKGFEILMTVPMSDPLMKVKDLDRLWMVWEPEQRALAEQADDEQRRAMSFARYGFIERDFDDSGLPLGYLDDGNGNLVNNCLSCHGGKVAGMPYPGLGNSHFDLTTLMTDAARLQALDRGEDIWEVEDVVAAHGTPYNMAKGVSNATMFAVILGALRDEHLDLVKYPLNPTAFLVHNDLIAPPWWHYKHKEKIYCDAFGSKTHRALMPFTMSPGNTGERIRSLEDEFVHIKAYIESVQPPKYPFSIDTELAAQGHEVFNQTCARCHGTYGDDAEYPNVIVPIEEIGTDRVRYDAVPPLAIAGSNRRWFSNYGKDRVDPHKEGYIAPPLDGIWAKAPYFHNGSVPTIEGVMNQSKRPAIWTRQDEGYDQERLGLVYESIDEIPEGLNSVEHRKWYDTSASSHGNAGHTFPDDELNAEEKTAVMEYLKTL